MAGESSGLWNNLPSIIIVEILSFLKLKDRLNASSVCKAWRTNLFHPKLWRKVVFQLNSCDNTKSVNQHGARFLAKHCGRFVRDVVIQVNSSNPRDVQLCKEVLNVLTHNNNLRALSIKPLSSRLEWTDYNDTLSLDQYVDSLISIIKRARSIEHLSLGCIEELLDRSPLLLPLLAQLHSFSLRSLHLSSIKEVPGSYLTHPTIISGSLFKSFDLLESLSIDYDYLDDQLLEVLARPPRRMKRLNVHVHKLERGVSRPSDDAWKQISTCSPNLEVTITLLHLEGDIRNLLSPEMPLANFRAYFSSGFRTESVAKLAYLNDQTLRSLVLVDGLNDDDSPMTSFLNSRIDPLIILAWRCQKLTSMKIIGYEVDADSLIAISRLRGEQLQELLIPGCCINSIQLEESEQFPRESAFEHMGNEVSFALQKFWQPLTFCELPLAVRNINADADGAYLEELLRDQTW
ncbi:hypothetical protein JTE90_028659 [Oedothorax gibbosus]|uniref:F-box domain-containing protein n=1 Tax=Oedothorax gibbosus TaxID=931172 RepID=A0AAV6UXA3_9ARAC|nr:hypothetical protein JTE90_028659 [Oedothorax gibbosus]